MTEQRELDEELRIALTGDTLDVSQVLGRVRQEMRPVIASRRSVPLGAIAAGWLVAIAADAECDHNEEPARLSLRVSRRTFVRTQ